MCTEKKNEENKDVEMEMKWLLKKKFLSRYVNVAHKKMPMSKDVVPDLNIWYESPNVQKLRELLALHLVNL